MYKSRWRAAMMGLLLLIAFIALCLCATLWMEASRTQAPQDQSRLPETELYRNQGLDPGRTLSATPAEVREDMVVFADRVLLRPQASASDEETVLHALRAFLSQDCLQNQQIVSYLMVVPLRIGFEETFSQDPEYLELVRAEYQKMKQMETDLLAGVEGYAAPVPVNDLLKAHEGEYLFYRTDAFWTARGAYYGAQAFLETAKLDTFPLDAFWEYAQDKSTELLAVNNSVNGEIAPPDRQYYYLFQNYNPLIGQVRDLDTIRRSPMIVRNEACNGIFLGSGYDYCTWDGLAENGRSLLIVDTSGGNVLAPWMVTQFEHLTCLDLENFDSDNFDFEALLKECGVTDLLVVMDVAMVSEQTASLLNDLTGIQADS